MSSCGLRRTRRPPTGKARRSRTGQRGRERGGKTRLSVALLFSAALALLGGCTGIPSSSSVEVIQTLGAAEPVVPAVSTPVPGAEQRSIVAGFLANNASSDEHHSAARAFLTTEATNRWSDNTATIVSSLQVGNPDAHNQVTAAGQLIGTLDTSGVYTPALLGDGTGNGGAPSNFKFVLKNVDGQWRIDNVKNGLVLTESQFQSFYPPRAVYFYDQGEQHLVADLRYTAISDPGLLATWLMTQMAQGPRPALQSATATELPAQTDPRRVTVTVGSRITVEVPGSSQLVPATRDRLAAQIAATIKQAAAGLHIAITDGGRAISTPRGGTEFVSSTYADALAISPDAPALYYVAPSGAVVNSLGKPVHGPIGNGEYSFVAVALRAMATDAQLQVAGTVGSAEQATLYIGTTAGRLRKTSVGGRLSRPAWAPNLAEAWVGDGKTLYRVSSSGAASAVQVTAGTGKITGAITAVRFSPEGSRVALVIQTVDGAGQLWIGSVVRSAASVQVTNLELISPQAVTITDVAWNDELKLFAVGRGPGGVGNVYELQCDGSLWAARGVSNLPGTPVSITVAENVVAAVAASGTVWVQSGVQWESPAGASAAGNNPVYVE